MEVNAFLDKNTIRCTKLTKEHIKSSELIISSYAASDERGQQPLWKEVAESTKKKIMLVEDIGDGKIRTHYDDCINELPLNNQNKILDLLFSQEVLIDISAFPCHIWATLMNAAYKKKLHVRVLYTEPDEYKLHPSPSSFATRFELSSTVKGLSPLPGFVNLRGAEDENKTLFIGLLGFEGNRPSRLIADISPTPKVFSIIGIPGFQIEFPAYAIAGNGDFFKTNNAFSNIEYARASCPFQAYKALENIKKEYPDYYMYIAPVGTKPHALGAILFALKHPEDTEIMYDHPIRMPGKTKGLGTVHIYDFQKFENF